MARPTTILPTNTTITYPAYSASADIEVLNTNFGNIAEAVNSLEALVDPLINNTRSGIANVNANDYIATGCYFFATGCSNVPGDYGELIVFCASSTNIIFQLYSLSSKVYFREYRGGSWGIWIEVANMYTIHSVNASVPVNTPIGSYKIGTFTSLGIPSGSTILCCQCSNVTSSVCHISGYSVSGEDIYVYLTEAVAVSAGQVRVVYKAW